MRIDDFKFYLQTEKRLHPNTIKKYCSVLQLFLSNHKFTETDTKSFLYKKESEYSEACANHYAKAFRHYGRFTHAKWSNTLKIVEEHPNEYELLSLQELWNVILLKPYPNKYSVFFLLMASTGRRGAELLNLERSDVTYRFIYLKSKTKEYRRCAVRLEVHEVLQQYISTLPKRCKLVFPNYMGSKMTTTALVKEFKVRLKTLGINKKTRVYDLRHNYITRQVRNNPLPHVQYQVGHKKLNTTQRYVHPNDDDLLELSQHDVMFQTALSEEEYLRQFIEQAERYGILKDGRFEHLLGNDRLEIRIRKS